MVMSSGVMPLALHMHASNIINRTGMHRTTPTKAIPVPGVIKTTTASDHVNAAAATSLGDDLFYLGHVTPRPRNRAA